MSKPEGIKRSIKEVPHGIKPDITPDVEGGNSYRHATDQADTKEKYLSETLSVCVCATLTTARATVVGCE